MAINPINLGSFYTNSSGNSVSSGLSSGINTDSLIKALTASQESQVTKLNDQVTVNNKQVTALTSLNQILTNLQSAIKPLSTPNSLDTTNNLFAVRSSLVTSNTTQAAANYMTATVTSGTSSGSYTISAVTQLATKASEETQTSFTLDSIDDSVVPETPALGFFSAGTIVVKDKNITIAQGDSLRDIAQAFNDVSADTGIAASVLQTSAGQYKLVFSSTTTGAAADFSLSDPAIVTSDPSGVLDNITFHKNVDAEDAAFKLNGVNITRASNNISDLIEGVTINLLQDTVASPGASFTLQISPDVDSIATGVTNFANAYNQFLYFYSQQTGIDTSTNKPTEKAVLYSDTTLRNLYNSVTTIATSLVKGLADDQPGTLSSIGINLTDYAGDSEVPATANILSVDNSKLKSLLSTNFTGVANVLGDSFISSSGNVAMYQSPTNTTVNSFKLTVVNSSNPPVYTATYRDSDNVQQSVALTGSAYAIGGTGYTLKGPAGSVFDGLVLLFDGNGDESNIDLTVSQGLLYTMQNQLKGALETSTGLIAQGQKAITERNTTLEKQITTVNEQMTIQREALLKKYSQLEAAITKANSVLNLLNAQQLASQT